MPTPISRLLVAALLMATGGTAAMAQQASSAPDVLSETYRDWVVVCRNAPAQESQPGLRLCEMTQDLRQQEDGQRVLSIALSAEDEPGAGLLTIITPFGVKVSDQVVIKIDGVTVVQAPFQTCLPRGCIVQTRIDPDSIEIMRNDADATLTLPISSGADLEVSFSLLGLGAAWDRLSDF